MNWIDLLIALPILIGIYKGYKRGVLFQASQIFIWVFGLYISKVFSENTAKILKHFDFIDSKYLTIVATSLNFLILIVGVYLIRKLIEKTLKILWLNQINKIIGAVIGGIKGFIFVGVVIFCLNFLSEYFSIEWKNKLKASAFFQTILALIKGLYNLFINKIFN